MVRWRVEVLEAQMPPLWPRRRMQLPLMLAAAVLWPRRPPLMLAAAVL